MLDDEYKRDVEKHFFISKNDFREHLRDMQDMMPLHINPVCIMVTGRKPRKILLWLSFLLAKLAGVEVIRYER